MDHFAPKQSNSILELGPEKIDKLTEVWPFVIVYDFVPKTTGHHGQLKTEKKGNPTLHYINTTHGKTKKERCFPLCFCLMSPSLLTRIIIDV